VRINKAAERYAISLYQLAQEQGVTDTIKEELAGIHNAIHEVNKLENLLHSPVVQPLKKGAILQQIFAGQVSSLTSKFLDLLARRSRIDLLADICTSFIQHYNEQHGLVELTIRTATDISDDLLKQLVDKVESTLGKKALVETTVDPNLLGGWILELPDRYLDASLSTQLQQIRKSFQEPAFHNTL